MEASRPQSAPEGASKKPKAAAAQKPTGALGAAPPAAAPTPSPSSQPNATARPAPAPQAAVAPEPIVASVPDFEKIAQNVTRMMEQGTRVLAAYMRPFEQGASPSSFGSEAAEAVKSLGRVAEYWLTDPTRTLQAQTALTSSFITLWSNTLRRMSGEEVTPLVPVDPRDKRFADPQWRESPVFDFIRQAYSLVVNWANTLVSEDKTLDPLERAKAAFYVRQMAAALSPSNFLATNPELIRTTFKEEGENLVRGLHMLAEDLEAGKGTLRLRQADNSKFELGVNLAITPGKVVWRNDLIELIQYAPSTKEVYKRPLLIVPPWINKFYILDLHPEKSFIKWCVDQGLTVFVVSWVNPDSRHGEKGFDDYMREGVFESLEAIETITGEKQVTSIGYCVGGTLMAMTLAYMAAIGDTRISSSTLFTTQVDFTDPGDLKVFTDKETIASVETQMATSGYLDGSRMANAFNMLRPNDLIWSYVVNNYIKGQMPMAFDLLTWNSDSTRMTRANHSFYLRECYLTNNLANKRTEIDGVKLDLSKVTIPIYDLAAKEDHIAPAKSAFNGAKLFGGEVRYVMAGSGHIAGVVNPPYKPKYQYWTGPKPAGDFHEWVRNAKETAGSWWPDWIEWIRAQAPEKVPAREPGGGKLPALGDAPGEYVRIKC
ncbi:MAG: class I poly(R)-hydroxyalkanoic acid synthase [Hyphomicrobiales bacterium]|nr:class I poly(R)-hydroxyalkanoic acid synthase [Hyphomicrobiales bacterium]